VSSVATEHVFVQSLFSRAPHRVDRILPHVSLSYQLVGSSSTIQLHAGLKPGTVVLVRIVGHGIDLVEVDYFRRLILGEFSNEVLERSFTGAEREYATKGAEPAERLAGRFAAKEAVLKALGIGWTSNIAWTDVEVTALPSGAPQVVLHANAREAAQSMGVTAWLLSITHTRTTAASSAIAIAEADTG
jgi:holo-[acyl-carrier protein] synthase